MKHILLAMLISLSATLALAHSKVNTTTPADGAAVAVMPKAITLAFAKRIRLTRVDMIYMDHPAKQLELGDQAGFAANYSVPVQDMGKGPYQIEWRGLGMDGHAMQGAFTFQVE